MSTRFLAFATMVDSAHPAVAELSQRHRGAPAHQPDKRGA